MAKQGKHLPDGSLLADGIKRGFRTGDAVSSRRGARADGHRDDTLTKGGVARTLPREAMPAACLTTT
jgi:hypothetical protein